VRRGVVAGIAALHFVLAGWFATFVLESVPHVPDSAVYYRMGILLGEGRLGLEGYPCQPWDAFRLQGAVERGGRVVFQFQHFWPALLALPIRLGVAQLVNPLLGALCVVLVFRVGRRLFDPRAGLVASLLFAVSPLAVILDGSFMLHTGTLFGLLLFLNALLTFAERPQPGIGLVAGIALGWALALRPLTTAAVALPVVVYGFLRHREPLRRRQALWIVAGFAPLLALIVLDNIWITGTPLPPQEAFNHHAPRWSSLPLGANHVDALLGALPPILFSTSLPLLGLALAAAAVISSRWAAAEWMLAAIFVCLVGAHLWIDVHGLHGYGPRFLFEGTFALFLLIARAGVRAWDVLRPGLRVVLAVLALAMFADNAVALARVLPAYRHYNGIDTRLLARLQELDLERSVVVATNPYWQGLDIAATLFDPDYETAVFIRELPDGSHTYVLGHFHGRRVYRVVGNRVVPLAPTAP
jgi:hypothetical protein